MFMMDNKKYAKYMGATYFCRSMLRMRKHNDHLNIHDMDNMKYAKYMLAKIDQIGKLHWYIIG